MHQHVSILRIILEWVATIEAASGRHLRFCQRDDRDLDRGILRGEVAPSPKRSLGSSPRELVELADRAIGNVQWVDFSIWHATSQYDLSVGTVKNSA